MCPVWIGSAFPTALLLPWHISAFNILGWECKLPAHILIIFKSLYSCNNVFHSWLMKHTRIIWNSLVLLNRQLNWKSKWLYMVRCISATVLLTLLPAEYLKTACTSIRWCSCANGFPNFTTQTCPREALTMHLFTKVFPLTFPISWHLSNLFSDYNNNMPYSLYPKTFKCTHKVF